MNHPTPPDYSISRWAMIALGIAMVSYVLWTIRNILLLGFAAIILVVFINIPVSQLKKLGIPRFPAIIITFVGSGVLIYALALLVLPILFDQFYRLANITIPFAIEEILAFIRSGEAQEAFPFLEELDINISEELQAIDVEFVRDTTTRAFETLRQVGGSVVPFISGIANTLLSFLIVFFLTMFFLANPNTYRDGFVKLFPLWYRPRVGEILERLNFLLRRWIFAALIGMSITGIGTFIGLSLIGIREAIALAVLTSLLSFVPNFGELLAVVIALAVGSVQAPDSLVWIVLVIYGVSFIQGQIFGPLVTSEAVNIPPVLVLLGQIVTASFFGVLGIVFAVPIMVVATTLVQEIYIKDILGDYDGDEIPENAPVRMTATSEIKAVNPADQSPRRTTGDKEQTIVSNSDDGLLADGV